MTPQQLKTAASAVRDLDKLLCDLEVTLDSALQPLPASRLARAREILDAAASDLEHAAGCRVVARGRRIDGEWTVDASPEVRRKERPMVPSHSYAL